MICGLCVILNIFLNLFVALSSSLFIPWLDQGKVFFFLQVLLVECYGETGKKKTTTGVKTFGRVFDMYYNTPCWFPTLACFWILLVGSDG